MKKMLFALVMSLFMLPAFGQNNDNANEKMHHGNKEMHENRGHHDGQGHKGLHHGQGKRHHRGGRMHFASPEKVDLIYNYVNDQMSSNDKKKAVKLCMQLTPMKAEDISRMIDLFSFDDDKMEILEFCYPLCPNKEKYVIAIDKLSFSSNKDKMYKMMATHQK
ncbi:MAG: DUF4476 domain-containing protein [Bacteroidales bacterium]|nr:DUF4476 domain-containing protein [Bacteroidales bacterium]